MAGQRQFKPNHSGPGRTFDRRKSWLRLYDREWEKYRLVFLRINPKCYSCGETATVVDHLRSHQGDEKLFKQLDNHIPLCSKCHNTVTALFDSKFRPGGSIESKITWLKWTRAKYDSSFRVKVLPSYENPDV